MLGGVEVIVRRNNSGLFIVIIIIVLIVTGFFFTPKVFSRIKLKPTKSSMNVKVCKAHVGNVHNQVDVTVFIKSQNYKEYYGNNLRVQKILVKPGDYVQKGQKLISFDNVDMITQSTQAQIQLENAILQKNQMIINRDNFKKQKEALQDEIDRIKEAREDNESFVAEVEESFESSKIFPSKNTLTISTYNEELEKLVKEGEDLRKVLLELERQRDAIPVITDDQIKLMENSIVLAENSLKNIQSKLESYKDIEADFPGIVTNININEGSYSQPGAIIAILQDTQNIKGLALISQQNVAKVKEGQEIVMNDPIGVYNGKIKKISELAINSSNYSNLINGRDIKDNYLVAEIEILNPNDKLKIDFDLEGKILLEDKTDILKVPIECVLYDENNTPYVYIVKEGIAHKTPVVTGGVFNNYIQVLEGVNSYDNIVISPPKDIKDKEKVKVVGSK